MKKITVNSREVEAYDLIMRKEHALEIIAGKKPLEIRAYSDHYIKMFSDKKIAEANEVARKEGRVDDFTQPFRQDVAHIHFHNYNSTWTLDVSLSGIGVAVMSKGDIEWLADNFNFHDYDNEWQQYSENPDESPEFFYLVIDKVVAKTGF